MFGENGLANLDKFLKSTAEMNDKERQEAWKNSKEMTPYRKAMEEVSKTGHMGGLYDYYMNQQGGDIAKQLASGESYFIDSEGNRIAVKRNKNGKFNIGEYSNLFSYDKENGFRVSKEKEAEFLSSF